jgi:uncharacterized protein YjbI with pentapeptide repeats
LVVLFVLAAVLCAGSAAFAFDKNHLMKFKATNECPNCDLSGAFLKGADLKKANLRGADFTGANIGGANMRGARFCKSKMPWGLDNTHC